MSYLSASSLRDVVAKEARSMRLENWGNVTRAASASEHCHDLIGAKEQVTKLQDVACNMNSV